MIFSCEFFFLKKKRERKLSFFSLQRVDFFFKRDGFFLRESVETLFHVRKWCFFFSCGMSDLFLCRESVLFFLRELMFSHLKEISISSFLEDG